MNCCLDILVTSLTMPVGERRREKMEREEGRRGQWQWHCHTPTLSSKSGIRWSQGRAKTTRLSQPNRSPSNQCEREVGRRSDQLKNIPTCLTNGYGYNNTSSRAHTKLLYGRDARSFKTVFTNTQQKSSTTMFQSSGYKHWCFTWTRTFWQLTPRCG